MRRPSIAFFCLLLVVLTLAGTSQFGAAFVAAGLLAVAPAYYPSGWNEYQTLAFGVIALIVALQLPQRYDLRGRVARAARGSASGPCPLTSRYRLLPGMNSMAM